jgi:integrase
MKRKPWSKSFGPYGCRVRVFERVGGMIYRETRLKGQRPDIKSLEHRDRGRAVEEAKAHQAKLALGMVDVGRAPTLGAVLDAWEARQKERAAELRPGAETDTARVVTYWKAMLGATTGAAKVTLDAVERACERRRTGAVNARGEAVEADKRLPVRARAVAADLEGLRAAFRWACIKRRMLRENPLMGLEIAEEANPRRPVATADRYEKTREVAERVTMELRGDGKRVEVPSWLPELLDLAYATGRRIGAICALRYDDLRLDVKPHGAIRWPRDTDKEDTEWTAAIDERARKALDRVAVDREVGTRGKWPESPYLFPSPRTPAHAVSKDLASDWLERAEVLAKLPKLDGSLWHAYRRGWATARKHYPAADVAAAGGWKTRETLERIYNRADPATTLRVILEPHELRD